MNIAIGVWTLVLGGVLIPGGDSFTPGSDMAWGQGAAAASGISAGVTSYSQAAWGSLGQMPGSAAPGLTYPAPRFGSAGAGRTPSSSPAPAVPSAPFGESPQTSRRPGSAESLIPFAPTDPSAASSAYPWGPPTAAAPPGEQFSLQPPFTGAPSTVSPGVQAPSPTGYGRPMAAPPPYRGYVPYSSYASQMARIPASGLARGPASAGSVSKPYQDYRRPLAVSPYMRLGQVTSVYGDIDAYSTFVRPELEQLSANQRVGTQIHGLQRSMQTLRRQTQSLRGIVIPQYYMNYGSYYPGLPR